MSRFTDLRALATGDVVIATRSFIADVVATQFARHGRGALVVQHLLASLTAAARDVRAVSDFVVALLTDDNSRRRFSREAIDLARSFPRESAAVIKRRTLYESTS